MPTQRPEGRRMEERVGEGDRERERERKSAGTRERKREREKERERERMHNTQERERERASKRASKALAPPLMFFLPLGLPYANWA